MNAIPDHSALMSTSVDWVAIYADVNTWRGECLHHFTAVEHAVTNTLLSLAEVRPDSPEIALRHLIGQRFEDLAKAIGPDGPFGDLGKKSAAKALSDYRERHEAFRTHLCHGLVSVAVMQNGQWTLVLRTLSIKGRHAQEGEIVIDKAAATSRLAQLRRDRKRLVDLLGQVRKAAEKT